MIKCEYCNEELLPGIKYCPHCGAKVETTQINNNDDSDPRSDTGSFGLGFLIGIIFGTFALLIWFFFAKRKTRKGIWAGFFTRIIVYILYIVFVFFLSFFGFGHMEFLF